MIKIKTKGQKKTKKLKISSFHLSGTMNRKGQMKIQQMAFMLMAVTLFFVLVGMFVLVVKFNGLKQSATNLEEENSLLLANKLANSPEFSCGDAFNYGETNCIDFDKVMALKSNIKKYEGFWDVASIEIRKIYPKETEKDCNSVNYPDCTLIKVYSKNVNKGPAASNFVSLCRKEKINEDFYDKCELAKIYVSYEDKR